MASCIQHEGTLGPNKERQEGPHAHQVYLLPNSNLVMSADLGLDKVIVYQITEGFDL